MLGDLLSPRPMKVSLLDFGKVEVCVPWSETVLPALLPRLLRRWGAVWVVEVGFDVDFLRGGLGCGFEVGARKM